MDAPSGPSDPARSARRPSRPLRMPLLAGRTPAWDLVVLGSLGGNLVALVWAHALVSADSLLLAAGALSFVWLIGLVYVRDSLFGGRPADVVLDREGLRILGGSRDGLSLGWDALDASASTIENDVVKDAEGAPLRGVQLWLQRVDGARLLFGEVYQSGDRAPLYVLLDELRGAQGLPPLPPPSRSVEAVPLPSRAPVDDTELLRCARCGAAATPADAARVTCDRCDGPVPVPEALRARLRGHLEDRRRESEADAAWARLAAQPDAARANRRLLGLGVVQLGLPVLGGLASHALLRAGPGGVGATIAIYFVVLGLGLALTARFERVVADRVALRSGLSELAARRGADGDARPCCRSCGAVLPLDRPGQLVRCPYCETDSLLVEDLRSFDGHRRDVTLQSILDARTAQAEEARGMGRVALGLASVAAIGLGLALALG